MPGAWRAELKPLGPFALHPERDLLDVEDKIGDIFTNAREAAEFVENILDLERGDGCALKRRKQHAAQRVAERQAKTALKWFGDKACFELCIGAGALFKRIGFFEFLPVFAVDCHGLPLGVGWMTRPPYTD